MNTGIRISLVLRFLLACIRYRAVPWYYFHLNSRFFNPKKGIFSKLEMDALIPEPWRLPQYYFHPRNLPAKYPVFIKPEWGQNANGIVRADNQREFQAFAGTAATCDIPFIVQGAAPGRQEFEIYYLRSSEHAEDYQFLSVTRVTNTCIKAFPVNSIHNPCTRYEEITHDLDHTALETLWGFMKQIGRFRMARVGVKADNLSALISGRFHVVEINLFLPMPLVLLSCNVPLWKKTRIMQQTMSCAARLARTVPRTETREPIFFPKMKAHYKVSA
ncbi:MAG: hypothetical protein LC657_09860 [Desulfobacteraceae bacterium]|nr:hypothetical protein [Desulfobacteraceae bacterium]